MNNAPQDYERQIKMFGMTTIEVLASKPGFYSNGLYAMAILSDVQEVLARLDTVIGEPANHASLTFKKELETARQWINKAKFFIAENKDKDGRVL